MPSEIDNTAQDNRGSASPSQLKLTSAPKDISTRRKIDYKGRGVENSFKRPQGWWEPEDLPGHSDLERLLLLLHNFYVPAHLEFPITVQFITHGLRTTVIFERVTSPGACGEISRRDL